MRVRQPVIASALLLALCTALVASAGEAVRMPLSERAALDSIYERLARREFAEAQAEWRPIALAVQQSIEAAATTKLAPAAEAALRQRVGEVVFVQALLEARLGRKEDALELLRKADGYGFPPLDSPLMALAAECLLELGEPALAAQAYREMVKAQPANTAARLALGVALYGAGRLDGAAKELAEVVARAPGFPRAHFYLGAVLLEQKKADEARRHLERELAREPRCAGCMARLAHIAYLAGDDAQCGQWLKKASAVDPEDIVAHLVSGMLHNRSGRPELAIPHLLRVVERAPTHAKAHYQLVLAYQRSAQPEKALEHRAIYDKLLAAQQAKDNAVRGGGE